MKAKELMLGDYTTYEGTIYRVYELNWREVFLLDKDGKRYVAHHSDVGDGVSLTPEILEKNWFRYERDYGSFNRSILGDYAKDKEPVVCIGWRNDGTMYEWDIADGKGGASYGKHPLYVHELQHALRLCGLDELADNFKI